MKKLCCTIFALLLLILLPIGVRAMEFTPEAGANTLYELGLFQGTGTTANGRPNYSLHTAPTRAQAVTMLVRLLGRETEAKAGSWTLPFTDVEGWAQPYVGYAYANGLTKGLSETAFGSSSKVTVNQYLAFLLRALGYSSETDFAWNNAADYAASLGLRAGQDAAKNASFTRGDVAAISAAAHPELALGASGGFRLCSQSSGAVWRVTCAQTDRAGYFDTVSADGVVTLQTEHRILDLISRTRLQKLADDLATAYADYAELTGWDAAKQMFRTYSTEIPSSAAAQLELFVQQLGKAGGIDARAMFSDAEWANAMKVGEL